LFHIMVRTEHQPVEYVKDLLVDRRFETARRPSRQAAVMVSNAAHPRRLISPPSLGSVFLYLAVRTMKMAVQ
jgi:hypothetical protein